MYNNSKTNSFLHSFSLLNSIHAFCFIRFHFSLYHIFRFHLHFLSFSFAFIALYMIQAFHFPFNRLCSWDFLFCFFIPWYGQVSLTLRWPKLNSSNRIRFCAGFLPPTDDAQNEKIVFFTVKLDKFHYIRGTNQPPRQWKCIRQNWSHSITENSMAFHVMIQFKCAKPSANNILSQCALVHVDENAYRRYRQWRHKTVYDQFHNNCSVAN